MEGLDETSGAGSVRALLDPAARKETALDDLMKGPTMEEIDKPTVKKLAAKDVGISLS